MFLKYLCEFLGTMMLILLGDGVVANVTLNKSGMKGAGSIQITLAWGLAVMVPAFIFGEASGASFNPALTIALAVGGMFDWALVPGYVIAQILGGIVGGVLVYILFKDHFDATEDPGTKLGVFSTGPSILRDELKIIESAPDSEYYAGKVKDTNGCYVVPAFTGLGAPHWDQYARGTIVGITRGVNKNHIIRATMESLAYQVNDILVAMQADSGIKLAALNVDGGASANNLLMQMQSDISGAPVQRPTCVETTAMGAAYLAGLAVGYWASKEDVVRNRAIDRVFHPEITAEERAAKVKGWSKAVKCSYGWAKDE